MWKPVVAGLIPALVIALLGGSITGIIVIYDNAGDVAIWDERCTLHHALLDHYPKHRKMNRCTVDGDRPAAGRPRRPTR